MIGVVDEPRIFWFSFRQLAMGKVI